MLDRSQKDIVASVLGQLNVSYDVNADTVTTILKSATLDGAPLDARQQKVVRRGLRVMGVKDAPKTPRPGYTAFIEYIACNDDESMIMDGDPSVCVSMVAHMFNKDTAVVIDDVRNYLENERG